MKQAIPAAVLAQHTAVVGKTGSGKTSTEKLMVEQVVAEGYRVCILDTIKSDWWGITSSASGKSAGLPFKILGGPRGHVPMHSSAGKVIGQLVGTGKLPLSIIDMADFEAGGIQRFFNDFAPALMRSMQGVVYLVIEEAHEIAPKERAGFGAENMAIHWAKKLATAGRSKGIRLIVATQRIQSLHNAVLGSCETVIAHRLTTPADQKPILDWLKANADRGIIEMVSAQLSSLKTGAGWICSGEARIFERIEFPKFKTFDNAATPTKDGNAIDVTTAAVNADELRALIGEAVKVAEADDPKALRARIIELEKAAAARPQPAHDRAAEDLAYKSGYDTGKQHGFAEGEAVGTEIGFASGRIEGFREADLHFSQAISTCQQSVEQADNRLGQLLDTLATINIKKSVSPAAATSQQRPVNAPIPRAAPSRLEQRAISKPSAKASGGGELPHKLQRCLDAIAWWRKIGIEPVERDRACVVAGLSPKASTFGVYVADLMKRGLVQSTPGKLQLTEEGLRLANTPTAATTEDLRNLARGLLDKNGQGVFDVVYESYPNPIRRDDIAKRLGLSPTASTCGVYIARVASFGIIENAGPGQVKAADWLFPF
jgi:hypothetical protein